MKKNLLALRLLKSIFAQVKLELDDLSSSDKVIIFLVVFVDIMAFEVHLYKLLRILIVCGTISCTVSYFFIKKFYEDDKNNKTDQTN